MDVWLMSNAPLILGAFSLFSLVEFPNDECATEMREVVGAIDKGVCRSAEDCGAIGGVVDGKCASAFGVCCYKV